jgi:hypothetical protein
MDLWDAIEKESESSEEWLDLMDFKRGSENASKVRLTSWIHNVAVLATGEWSMDLWDAFG